MGSCRCPFGGCPLLGIHPLLKFKDVPPTCLTDTQGNRITEQAHHDLKEGSKKRSRSDVVARTAKNKQLDFTGVVTKWNTVFKEIIQRKIEQFERNTTKVALKAYHLVDIRLRCLQEQMDLHTLD